MAFLVGSFVVFVVNQRANKAKHSQFVSGVDSASYWLAAFVWDLLSFTVPSVLIVVVVLAFQTEAYSEWPVFGSVTVNNTISSSSSNSCSCSSSISSSNKSPAVARVSRPYSWCTLATCIHNCPSMMFRTCCCLLPKCKRSYLLIYITS